MTPSFAYLFERFPSFTQTFCYREVAEMVRQAGAMRVYSIRYPSDLPADCPAGLAARVEYLPKPADLAREMTSSRMLGRYPWSVVWRIRRWRKRPGKGRLLEAAWLGPKLKEAGVRHIHTHFAGIGARTAWWIKRFYGIPFSFTGHANDMFCETDSPVSLHELVGAAEFVVAVSDFSRDWLCRHCPGQEGKIHRVYNGMDLDTIPDAARPAGPPTVVSVGRSIEKKGFADLIAACAILRDQGLDFRCEIIGGGPLDAALAGQVGLLGLEGIVNLTGPLPQEEVRRRLGQGTLFVLACATEADGGMDTLPTVIAEAMAARLPVISTRLAAIPEMVDHGVTGLLVGERQPAELARAMAEVLRDPLLASRFGDAGHKLARERFSSMRTVAQLRGLIEGKAPCE